MGYLFAAMVALPVGFAAGFAVFKRSERWCPGCGSLITRAHCPHHYMAGAGLTSVEVPRV